LAIAVEAFMDNAYLYLNSDQRLPTQNNENTHQIAAKA